MTKNVAIRDFRAGVAKRHGAAWQRLHAAAKSLLVIVAVLLIAACNSDDAFNGNGTAGGGNGNTGEGTAQVASVTLLSGSPQLGSNPEQSVSITAIVRDANNNLLSGVPVTFAATSGSLELPAGGGNSQPETNSSGQVTATLSAGGDYTNRTITVTASGGQVSSSVDVAVTGTSLTISGAGSAAFTDETELLIELKDSVNEPVPNRTLSVSSDLGNPISASTLTTSSTGRVIVIVTADTAGEDVIRAEGSGASASHALNVSGDHFQFLAPDSGEMLDMGECAEIRVEWLQNGSAAVSETVNFSTTRGTLHTDAGCTTPGNSAVTSGAGVATLWVTSANAGSASLTAFVNDGPSTSRTVNFIATVPATLNLQASPTTIGPNNSSTSDQQSTITATVRDANNNLVAGKLIRFSIIEDNSGGALTNATATTNLQGRATTTYVPSSATTAKDGVRIRAIVDENDAVTSDVLLTVAQSPLFVRLGTGNLINAPTSTTYAMPWTIIVTDASGNAAANAQIALSVNPFDGLAYSKGQYVDNGNNVWEQDIDDVCANEDVNLNGILDPGEDANGDGKLTPGNVASVPTSVSTGADGTVEINVTYPRQYGNWVRVTLTASSGVDGTESTDTASFWLPVLAADLTNTDVAPPGAVSPFGTGACP